MPPTADEHEITIRLDEILRERGMSAAELAETTGLTEANISKLKNAKVTAVRFSTLTAICRALRCGVGDILEYTPSEVPVTD
ncbi:helix-turn-helix domain-containing protein [Streptomyces cellulosae]